MRTPPRGAGSAWSAGHSGPEAEANGANRAMSGPASPARASREGAGQTPLRTERKPKESAGFYGERSMGKAPRPHGIHPEYAVRNGTSAVNALRSAASASVSRAQ